MMFCVIRLFIFFVKQKTAYEMRTSDWSSDVCSSDLFALLNSTASSAILLVFAIASLARSFMSAVRASVRALASSANFLTVSFMVLNPLVAAATGFGAALREIGRASCRERVLQYV